MRPNHRRNPKWQLNQRPDYRPKLSTAGILVRQLPAPQRMSCHDGHRQKKWLPRRVSSDYRPSCSTHPSRYVGDRRSGGRVSLQQCSWKCDARLGRGPTYDGRRPKHGFRCRQEESNQFCHLHQLQCRTCQDNRHTPNLFPDCIFTTHIFWLLTMEEIDWSLSRGWGGVVVDVEASTVCTWVSNAIIIVVTRLGAELKRFNENCSEELINNPLKKSTKISERV